MEKIVKVLMSNRSIARVIWITKRRLPPFTRKLDPDNGEIIIYHFESKSLQALLEEGIDRINGRDQLI